MHAARERQADFRAAFVGLRVWNYLRRPGTPAYTFGHFFPSLADLEQEQEEMTPEETRAHVRNLMMLLGGKPAKRAQA